MCMHKPMSPHGDYDYMGEALNLVKNFKVDKVIFNCDEFNDLEVDTNNVFKNAVIAYKNSNKDDSY